MMRTQYNTHNVCTVFKYSTVHMHVTGTVVHYVVKKTLFLIKIRKRCRNQT